MSRYLIGEHVYSYKGYNYCPEDDVEEDNVKRFHFVVTDGIHTHSRSVPLSPYSSLSEGQFQRWIDMGRPTREQMGGHQIEDHNHYWRKLFDEALDKILLGEEE